MVPALVIIARLVRALQDYPGFVALCHGYTLYRARMGLLDQHARGCERWSLRVCQSACVPAAVV